MTIQPKLDRLKSQLLTSGLQIKDNPLFQVINQLIDSTRQLQDSFEEDILTINNNITNLTVIGNKSSRLIAPLAVNAEEESTFFIPGIESLALPWSVKKGGTGLTSYAKGDIIYASAIDVLDKLTIGSVNASILQVSTDVPSWTIYSMPVGPISAGDVLYGGGTNTVSNLALGTAGKVFRSTGSFPAWSSFNISDTFAQGDIIIASSTNTLIALADIATGNALISGGVLTVPSWGKIGLTTHVTGTLPLGNGGTGSTSFTAGSIIFSNGTILTQDNSNLFWDDTNNRLGIGLVTPAVSLHISADPASAGAEILRIESISATEDAALRFRIPAVQSWLMGIDQSDSNKFKISSSELGTAGHDRLVINTSGNVGIGTMSPSSKLHIEGTSGWIIQDEQNTDPTITELDANDSVAIYNKNNKLVFAYNNAGTITYLTIPLDAATTTWTQSTSAP